MQLKSKTLSLQGKVQHYAWGGHQFIPSLIHFNNIENKPCAEYWMGAHPSAASLVSDGENKLPLNELITSNPATTITDAVYNHFGELPYLFKILDVKDMLSIQVHPTKIEAEKGFADEETRGIPINAPHRNYKDRNHKPEVMVALSEFWLLHGFKSLEEIEKTLWSEKEFHKLIPLFKQEGIKGLYQCVMELQQIDIDNMLTTLIDRELRKKKDNLLTKAEPGWWVCKLYEGVEEIKPIDRGIFSIYFFNIVNANPGEAVFQGAGIPHAYLEGQNVELMANSDNVLRGGLTPKHIDVPELMKHTLFTPIKPNVMKGEDIGNNAVLYPCPVPDFGIEKITLHSNQHESIAKSLEILIAIEGSAIINSSRNLIIKQGEVIAILPGEAYVIESANNCVLYKAFVPDLEGN